MRTKSKRAKPPRLKAVDLSLGYWKDGYYWHPQVNTRKNYLLRFKHWGYQGCSFLRCWNRGPLRFLADGGEMSLSELEGLWEIIG